MRKHIGDEPVPIRLAGRADTERADAARNRRLLLSAAKTLIDNHGAAAVTMDAVAREAGVGKGTVFRRFGSRTGLMFALLDHTESELQQAYLSGPVPLGPGADPLDRLLAYGRERLKLNLAQLDVLIEAGADNGAFWNHPAMHAASQHIQILLRQLGFTDPLDVTVVALLSPLGASALQQMTEVVGLDSETIITQWQRMVTSLVAGVRSH
ncbi:MAG: helix-turn-helix domain-containing protein [Gordonia sp. (in: high G+C Gram-positive bacteria)]